MARPLKEGLDYFPLDTRFDEKIQALESVFKNDGVVWIIKFWQLAYRTNNGVVFLDNYHGVIHAENCRVTLEKQQEIIKLCLEIKLLTKVGLNKYTSNGIKKRLEYVVGERERWRIKHKIGVISPIIPLENPEEMGESKVKESKVKEIKDIKDIISDLNLVLNSSYKLTSLKTKELIQARINEGHTLEDFKTVHRKMAKAWGLDNKMRQYLRPLTLYSNKFESYLNRPEDIKQLTPQQQSNLVGLNKTMERIRNDKQSVSRGICSIDGSVPGLTI